ncbi:hypothetical protein BMNI_I0040 [Brucella melitensis NI]|nr:hypothetical protein BMNI_I0040 [Brucella melitensis NI]
MHIDGVDTGGVGAENTIWRSKEIDPPDRGRAGFDPVAGEQASDCERGGVFADIAAFKPGGKDAIYPRLPQCSNIAARKNRALAQAQRIDIDRMGKNGIFSPVKRQFSENHPSPFVPVAGFTTAWRIEFDV